MNAQHFATEFTRKLFTRMLAYQNVWIIAHYFAQVPDDLRLATATEVLGRLGATGELWTH